MLLFWDYKSIESFAPMQAIGTFFLFINHIFPSLEIGLALMLLPMELRMQMLVSISSLMMTLI